MNNILMQALSVEEVFRLIIAEIKLIYDDND